MFLEPANPTHRQYEALRAYFVEGLASAEAARRFGYTRGSFRVLCHGFRRDPHRPFFLPVTKGPQTAAKRSAIGEEIIELRKQNLSIYDISRALQAADRRLSPAAVARLLKDAGFAKLPRRAGRGASRRPRPRCGRGGRRAPTGSVPAAGSHPVRGPVPVRALSRADPLERMLESGGFPGTQQVPAAHGHALVARAEALRQRPPQPRHEPVFDEGLALFAGLNVIPKRSFLTEYSCRIDPQAYPQLMIRWFEAMRTLGFEHGVSFDVDFHTIPFHGEDALLQKHYVSKRSRRQKGVLAFLAQDAEKRVFCYGNATVRKEDQHDEILRFVEYWKRRTGHRPEELVFDSRLTTYETLSRLNRMGIQFITLRRRDAKMLQEIHQQPLRPGGVSSSRAWPARTGPRGSSIRGSAFAITKAPSGRSSSLDLGHEEPTIVLTNQLRRSASHVVGRYAQRMLIENGIADGIDFFHMDALSSAVAMKVSCDLQLTLMASSLYRLLGERLGNGYATAKAQHIFRDFINAVATVVIGEREVTVRFQKRAHNPLLMAAGFAKIDLPVPWLGKKRLRLSFG